MPTKKEKLPTPTFGIGEWYGKLLEHLTRAQRQEYAVLQSAPKKKRLPQPCPFRSKQGNPNCSKVGGVCSIQLLKPVASGAAIPKGPKNALRATCPYRFHENGEIFRWVSEIVLNTNSPELVGEVGFLTSESNVDSEGGEDVGRLDAVLLNPRSPAGYLQWCALEIQAVYFSGDEMGSEFRAIATDTRSKIPFPVGKRHPDYRSSGPKRLMPQLQIKVPTLRRWGKKMAVVVDRAFFDSLGAMAPASDLSNSDIAWFIVRFDRDTKTGRARLVRDDICYTTLERAVEGLTGGQPVSQQEFERRIQQKLGPKKAGAKSG